MSLTAGKAIKSVVDNRDIALLMSEDREIFGSYGDVYDFIVNYYGENKSSPTEAVLKDKFGDDIFDGVPHVDGATNHYMNELREEFLKSSIESMLLAVDKNLHLRPAPEVLDKMASKVSDLAKYSSRVEDVDITDPEDALEAFEEAREAFEDGGAIGIKTGIDVWDEYMPSGLMPGMSVILMGYSSKGKSWAGELLAANAYRQGKRVLIISLEMPAHDQRARIWSILSEGKFYSSDLRRGQIHPDEVKDFGNDRLGTGGAILVSSVDGVGDVTPNIIRAKIDRHQPDLVVIDYLQLTMDNARTKEMTPRMLNLSREIKRLAVSAHVPIISISAVTDEESKKRNTPPSISQIAWSRGIEYDADIVMTIHQFDNTNIVDYICRKHRNGELFALSFEVDLARGVFTPKYDEDEE